MVVLTTHRPSKWRLYVAWACLAVAITIGVALVVTWNPPPEERFRAAVEAVSAGDFRAELMDEFRAVQRAFPNDPKPYVREAGLAGYFFQKTGKREFLDRAWKALDRARALGGGVWVSATCAYVANVARDRDRALQCFDEVQNTSPEEYVSIRHQLAEYWPDSELPETVTGIQLYSRAYWELRDGKVEQARAHVSMALADGMNEAWALLAQIEILYGDPAVAEDLYVRGMVAAGPARSHQAVNIAAALILQGRLDEAEEELAVAGVLDGAHVGMIELNRGDISSLRGNDAEAKAAYRKAVEAWGTPVNANAQALLAYAMARGSGSPEAAVLVRRAIAEDPQSPEAAWAAWQVGKILGDEELITERERAESLGISPWWIEMGEKL